MGSDAPVPAAGGGLPSLALAAAEPRKDGIMVLRRDSASSRSSSYYSAATPAHSSPRSSANGRLLSGQQADRLSDSPPLTPIPGHLLQPVDEEPDTPSSTIVEFGDLGRGSVPSAAQLVEHVHWSFRQSQVAALSESRSSSKARGSQDNRESRDGRTWRDQRNQSRGRSASTPSAPRERSQSNQRRLNSARDTKANAESERRLADERINLFLQSMA
ncbi:hypothetical protein MYCTH_2029812, partial [Thermothelomyces thermophilus ATCC 42464]